MIKCESVNSRWDKMRLWEGFTKKKHFKAFFEGVLCGAWRWHGRTSHREEAAIFKGIITYCLQFCPGGGRHSEAAIGLTGSWKWCGEWGVVWSKWGCHHDDSDGCAGGFCTGCGREQGASGTSEGQEWCTGDYTLSSHHHSQTKLKVVPSNISLCILFFGWTL